MLSGKLHLLRSSAFKQQLFKSVIDLGVRDPEKAGGLFRKTFISWRPQEKENDLFHLFQKRLNLLLYYIELVLHIALLLKRLMKHDRLAYSNLMGVTCIIHFYFSIMWHSRANTISEGFS